MRYLLIALLLAACCDSGALVVANCEDAGADGGSTCGADPTLDAGP